MIIPGLLSAEVYPNIRPELKNMAKFGGVTASKMIIDATKNWSYGKREEWGNDFYPPVAYRLSAEDEDLLSSRWKEYGLE